MPLHSVGALFIIPSEEQNKNLFSFCPSDGISSDSRSVTSLIYHTPKCLFVQMTHVCYSRSIHYEA